MIKDLKELYAYRQMIFSLVKKDLRGRYKGSVLGFMWTFINPLLQMGVYTLVFSIILRNDIDKYYLFLFVALVPWIFFSASLTGGADSVLASKDMLKKIYFPREVLLCHGSFCQYAFELCGYFRSDHFYRTRTEPISAFDASDHYVSGICHGTGDCPAQFGVDRIL